MSKKLRREAICWSADVSEDELWDVIDEKALPPGTMIKLDQVFFEKYGLGMISSCQANGYPVFADRKISEIPDKALQIAEIYLEYRPFMLNVMAGICSTGIMGGVDIKKVDALKRFADACKKAETQSCAVTVLTSKTPELAAREFGTDVPTQVKYYAAMMAEAGVENIVCSPHEVEFIPKEDLIINTPGIRMPNTDARDQARITTPLKAFENGADRLVIGSNLTDGEGSLVERLKANYAKIEKHLNEGGYEFLD